MGWPLRAWQGGSIRFEVVGPHRVTQRYLGSSANGQVYELRRSVLQALHRLRRVAETPATRYRSESVVLSNSCRGGRGC